MSPTRIYVGDLGDRGKRTDIERQFNNYGEVSEVWVARNPPGFAFVFMENERDAENAVRNLDGTTICGVKVRVEMAKGPQKGEKVRSGPRCYECNRIGHSARECTRRQGYVYQGASGRNRNSRRSRTRSRSRSRGRNSKRRSRSSSRDRSRRTGYRR